MANSVIITKLSDGSFSFVVNGDTANIIINLRNDMLSFGDEIHIKTSEGANLIKLQQVLYNEITIVDGATLPVATSSFDLRLKLRSVGFWDWMNSGGSGVDRYDQLEDTEPYFGNNGKVPVVNESELKLDYLTLPDVSYLSKFPSPLQPLKALRANSSGTAYEFYDAVNAVTQFIRSGYTLTSPSEDVLNSALALKVGTTDILPKRLKSVGDGVNSSFDIGTTAKVSQVFYNSVMQDADVIWIQTGSIITLNFVPETGALIQYV